MKTNRFSIPPTGEMNFTINYTESYAINQSEPHIHPDCEIYVNLSGDVAFEVEGRIYPVSRGSVIITRPYEYHHCILHSPALHKHFWITFSARQDEPFLESFFDRPKGYDNRIVLPEELLAEFEAIAYMLLKNNTDPLSQRIGVLNLFDILRKGKPTPPVENMAYLPRDVVDALLYMDAHLTEDVDMQIVAKLCGVSLNTLERHFKQMLQESPAKTLCKKRLFASMQCLRQGSSVADAAINSGFSDYSHYIQLFKKQFGMTPLQYKKNFQAE